MQRIVLYTVDMLGLYRVLGCASLLVRMAVLLDYVGMYLWNLLFL